MNTRKSANDKLMDQLGVIINKNGVTLEYAKQLLDEFVALLASGTDEKHDIKIENCRKKIVLWINTQKLLEKAEADLNSLQVRSVGLVNNAKELLDELKELVKPGLDKIQIDALKDYRDNKIVKWLKELPVTAPNPPAFRKALYRILAVLAVITPRGKEEPFEPYLRQELSEIKPDNLFVSIDGQIFDMQYLGEGIKKSGEWKNVETTHMFSTFEQEAITSFAKDIRIDLTKLADPVKFKADLSSGGVAPPTADDWAPPVRSDSSHQVGSQFAAMGDFMQQLSHDIRMPLSELTAYQSQHPQRFVSLVIASQYIQARLLTVERAKNLTANEATILDLTTLQGQDITGDILKERMQVAGIAIAEAKESKSDRKSTPPPRTSPTSSAMLETAPLITELSLATGRSPAEIVKLQTTNEIGFSNLITALPYLKAGYITTDRALKLTKLEAEVLSLTGLEFKSHDDAISVMLGKVMGAGIDLPPPITTGVKRETKAIGGERKSTPPPSTAPKPISPKIDVASDIKNLSTITNWTSDALSALKQADAATFSNLVTLTPYLKAKLLKIETVMGLQPFQLDILRLESDLKEDKLMDIMRGRMEIAHLDLPTKGDEKKETASIPPQAAAQVIDESSKKNEFIERLAMFAAEQTRKSSVLVKQPWLRSFWQSISPPISNEINASAAGKMIQLFKEPVEITDKEFDAFKSGDLGKLVNEMRAKNLLPANFLKQETAYTIKSRF